MSTHAEVFFERDDGTITGTHVHYDGYPDVCGEGMKKHSYATIKAAIQRAQMSGGLRFLGPDKIEGYDDRRSCVVRDAKDCRERYAYVKNRDGSVDTIVGGVRSRMHPPVSGITPHQLADFLEKNCGSRCLDDGDDVMAVVTALLDEFSISRR